jgi:phage shock protein E
MRDRTGHKLERMAVAAIVALGLAACSSGRSGNESDVASGAGPAAPVVSVDPTTTLPIGATTASAVHLVDVGTAQALAADPSVVVVDVRTPAEFAEGHIDRAMLVDFDAPGFAGRIAEFDHSATYLVYCHSGNRSGQATAIMADLGFTNVSNLDGGISVWQAAGAPIVR